MLCVQGDYDIPLSMYYDYVFTASYTGLWLLIVQGDYDIPLSVYYDYVFTAAEQSGVALMQPWELVPFHVPPGEPTPPLTSALALSGPPPCRHPPCAERPSSGDTCPSP